MNTVATERQSVDLHACTLTPEQLERFRSQGFLRIGALFDDELVQSLREEYDHHPLHASRHPLGARRRHAGELLAAAVAAGS